MSTSSIIPRDDTSKLVLLQQLNAQLPNYASALDITESDLAQLKVGLDWFDYSLKAQDTTQNYSHALVALKNTLRDGPKSSAINLPAPPVFPIMPASEPYADIFGFLGALITRIKNHKNYTDAIGKALKIIATQSPGIDFASLQPALSVDFQGGHPVLHWKNNSTDAIELEADHGTGTFSLMTIQQTPGYQDNTPLPPSGTAVLWKYRAIYRIRDAQIGHWSQVLEVGVKG
ncbi:MAG: hypothetical protein WCP01_05535 [Methylococcaceae bacterium]